MFPLYAILPLRGKAKLLSTMSIGMDREAERQIVISLYQAVVSRCRRVEIDWIQFDFFL
jgi:hypothetical protein